MIIVLFTILSFVISLPAFACPVCFSATGATLNAYRFSALFLTLIPLIAVGGFILWYRKKLQSSE